MNELNGEEPNLVEICLGGDRLLDLKANAVVEMTIEVPIGMFHERHKLIKGILVTPERKF